MYRCRQCGLVLTEPVERCPECRGEEFKARWPEWVERILLGERPQSVKVRLCGNVHRCLERAKDGEWKTVGQLRETPWKATEVQIASLLGWLQCNRDPFERGKRWRITTLGRLALEILNAWVEEYCPRLPWSRQGRWLGWNDWPSDLKCQERKCHRPYIAVPCEVNEEWVEHLRRYVW